MPKKILFFFTLILFCNSLLSQNTVSGKIVSQQLESLSGAHIHMGRNTISSDYNGNYSISYLPSGPIKVNISFVGYKSIDTIINLQNDLKLDFKLVLHTANLQEIVIQQKTNSLNKSVAEQRIKTETIEKYSNKTLGDVLKEVTGVSSLKSGNAVVKPIINGLYGSRVPVINNNVRLEDQQWGTEHAPNLDINSAGKITVIKGASGLQYSGDAVGGLVIIEPVSVKKDTLFGKTILNYDTNGKGGSISSSLHKGNNLGFSWNALGTFKYLGDKNAPDYVLSNTGNREANFSGDLKYSREKYDFTAFYSYYNAIIGILSASHTGNVNDLYNSITNKTPAVIKDFTYSINNPKQEVQHHIAKLNYNYYFNETEIISFQYAFQYNKRLEYDVRRGNYKNTAALDLELKTHSFNVDYKKNLHDWNLKSGLSTGFQNNFANPKTGIRPLIPNYDKIDFGFYSVLNQDFTDTFSVDGGIRYDFSKTDATKYYQKSRWEERGYNEEFEHFIVADSTTQWLTKPSFTFHNISASLGFHKVFENNLDWLTNVSFASRNPNPSEFFSDGLHHSTGVIELGDLNLDKEQATKLSITLQKKYTNFSLDINPYINKIKNYMFLRPVGFETTIRGAFPIWEYQQTNARLTGVDLQTNWVITNHWTHLFSLAYVNGRDISNKQSLIDIPPLNVNNKISFSTKEWYHLLLELKSEIVFKQNKYPDNNFYTNIIKNDALESVLVDISTPPPAYHLLHFYSEMKLPFFYNIQTTLGFSVQNILDTKYRDYLNRQRFFADEIGRSFQIQLKFNY
ncbi:TonB-dependent receptor domain-containing protein [Flavobacterium piscis]|uniref:Iron complex outermembrane receptor protein n=1 Tax=Flavobacterium piscis TaxID=1114874 RepID=A0ABU1YBE8_9FLAO|nr:TonB-dependent receptor [Flavobacterium piscis]MDR7211565.1 iron complex outermembrane receptor protein [Flavobacterium piscis]